MRRVFFRDIVRLGICVLLVTSAPNASATENLLRNPGFEEGQVKPEGWHVFPGNRVGIAYVVDDTTSCTGRRSARIDNRGGAFGMWQQVVDVQPGRVYELTGQVAFREVVPTARCNLQLVFRNSRNRILEFIDYPGHTGTREFALDFPQKLKVRAPDGAAHVEVNLFLAGRGTAWFDDIHFGAAPTGDIAGRVTGDGRPLADARVFIWKEPWGKPCETRTDSQGRYRLADVPVTMPRYIVIAAKAGYRTRPAGNVAVKENTTTSVDFDLISGADPDDLRVKFGSLSLVKLVPGARIPDGAVIPDEATDYPEHVRPYLEPDEYIQSDHPEVIARAEEIVASLPVEDRGDTRKVVWALYAWISRHIDHDGVFSVPVRGVGLNSPFRDVTSGIWQTIAPDGWSWGRSFYDWCYRPNELLAVEGGICVEHAWLMAAMCRALNIPARAAVGSMEYWAQSSTEDGVWVHGSTTGDRTSFRERGKLGPGFEGSPPETRFSVLSRPILHEDWNAQNEGLWRERHPWRESYDGSPEGLAQARADHQRFAETGEAPHAKSPRRAQGRGGAPRERLDRQGSQGDAAALRDLATQRQRPRIQGDRCQIHYSDVTISLLTMDSQRTLDVRFPMSSDPDGTANEPEHAYWTNHPECVRRTWVEIVSNPPAQGQERWFHVEFDLAGLLD